MTFFDDDLARRLFDGEAWNRIADAIVAELPDRVYVSFDIDGLEPALCPSTGTPVPCGLSFRQACALVRAVAESVARSSGSI